MCIRDTAGAGLYRGVWGIPAARYTAREPAQEAVMQGEEEDAGSISTSVVLVVLPGLQAERWGWTLVW